jgi:hypothetical protein
MCEQVIGVEQASDRGSIPKLWSLPKELGSILILPMLRLTICLDPCAAAGAP